MRIEHSPRTRPNRDGFTVLEMLISTALLLFVLGVSTQFLRRQSNSITSESGRLEAQQNAIFGITSLERELRTAGVGVPDRQPMLVFAGARAVVFNSDLVSRVKGDPSPVYVDVDADSDAVEVFRASEAVSLPTSTATYPDTTYMLSPGVFSNAETIAFWLSQDSTSTRSNEYILFRRINALPPRVVARGIVLNAADTVFQYFKSDTLGNLAPVVIGALPLRHVAKIHGSPADTGKFATIDSVRTIRVRFTTVYHDPRTGDATRRLERTIRIMNAGLIDRTTCGDAPLSVAPVAIASALGASSPFATITWSRSVDEATGEKDVERYTLFKRLGSELTFSEPFASVPAGSTTYSFTDTDVRAGESWIYGVAAQDCSPTSSAIGTAPAVVIP
jgi:hypothetical protein